VPQIQELWVFVRQSADKHQQALEAAYRKHGQPLQQVAHGPMLEKICGATLFGENICFEIHTAHYQARSSVG
jgi:hypothetical protein